MEIGANTTIDRGTLGRTWIRRGVKIDNLVQIAHNVVIGEHSVIVAQVGISGSTHLGKGVVIGGQAGIVGHIRIGDGVMASARSGIHKDVPPGQIVAGAPHMPHREWLKMEACLPKLPEMREALAALQRRVAALEKKRGRKFYSTPRRSSPPTRRSRKGLRVGSYTIIGPDVHIGKNTLVGPHYKTAVSGYDWWQKLIPPEDVEAGFYTKGEDQEADRQVVDAALPWLKERRLQPGADPPRPGGLRRASRRRATRPTLGRSREAQR